MKKKKKMKKSGFVTGFINIKNMNPAIKKLKVNFRKIPGLKILGLFLKSLSRHLLVDF